MSLSEFLNIAGAIGSIGIPFKDAAQARRLQSLHQSMEGEWVDKSQLARETREEEETCKMS